MSSVTAQDENIAQRLKAKKKGNSIEDFECHTVIQQIVQRVTFKEKEEWCP